MIWQDLCDVAAEMQEDAGQWAASVRAGGW